MKLLIVILSLLNWYYIPVNSPSTPVEVEGVDVNLKRNELAMTFLSLKDGEAALIQNSEAESILINTGGKNTNQELDKLLALFGVKTISTVILTYKDGAENLDYIVRKYKVKQIVRGDSLFQMQLGNIANDVKFVKWNRGDHQQLFPGLSAEVIYDGKEGNEGTDISFQFFHHQMFYISSASLKSEQAFLAEPLKSVNIVKLPFYASKGSFSDLLVEHMDPQLAIIFKSVSIKPDPDLIEMLHEAWIDVYFTKQHGTVTIKLTDKNYEVITISHKK